MDEAPITASPWPAFGLGALAVDGRLRLFSWTTGADRFLYLSVLRCFDRARQAYVVRLGVAEVAAALDDLRGDHPEVPEPVDLVGSLDALADWGVLDRSQESGRVPSIAEYRRRASVYQLTELGFIAHSAVERVVSARPDDAQLRAIALGAILEDLGALAAANRAGDAARVHLLLDRLHGVLADLAERAARFYLMIGELARVEEARPEVFVRHKDLLLAHLRDFHAEVQRYAPLLAAAVAAVQATGEDRLVEHAAEADPAPFAGPVERAERWRGHWAGLVAWFVGEPGAAPTVERLDARTTGAIADLAALLRQVIEARRSGVSRDAQLRELSAWCWAAPDDSAAAALWSAASGLRSARHLGVAVADVDAVPAGRSWWRAPPVEVSTTLREHGRSPSPGRPAALPDDHRVRQLGLARQRGDRARDAAAAAALVAGPLGDRVLDPAETALLLRLLDRALQSRSVVSGRLHGAGIVGGVRVRLRPGAEATVVRTTAGTLTLPGVAVEIDDAGLIGGRGARS